MKSSVSVITKSVRQLRSYIKPKREGQGPNAKLSRIYLQTTILFVMQILKTTRHLQKHILKGNFNPFDSPKNLGLGVGNCFCNFVNWLQMSFVVMFFWVVAADDRETIIL